MSNDDFLPISTAPKNGYLLLLLLAADETLKNPLEDSPNSTITIGFNNLEHDGCDVWKFSGWCWEHDHFTEGHGIPIGWLPLTKSRQLRAKASYGEEPRILTCVYCGHEYPQDTPAHGSEILTNHIRVCEKHPLRKAEKDISLLRPALVGLIGVDGEIELKKMEAAMRLFPAPEADKAVSINAIHALLATLPSS